MNSKGFFTFDAAAYRVYRVLSPHNYSPVFDDLWKEGPNGRGLGFISLVVWFWFMCACVCVCVDF